MKTIKKGVSVLLAFLLVLGMLAAMPATVSAATDDSQVTRAAADDEAVASAMYGDFKYDVMKTDDGYQYIAISGYTGSDTFVYIPDQIKGLYVQMIADGAFAQNQTMHEVRIPDYVEYIGIDAFSLCENLVNVYLPDYLYILSPFAFYGCTSLNYILIPSRVESYGYGAFAGCLNLKSFSVGAGNRILTTQGGVLYSNDEKILVEFPAGYEKTTFQVPSGVEMIAPYAFMWNNNLKEINIQNKKNCKAIGDYAFAYAISLQQVAIPATVTKIGEKILDGIPDVTIYTESDSYAHKYGTKNNIKCAFTVKSVKLNTNKISWPVGKSGSFKATVTPTNAKNKALTWKSSNPKVATVDANGKLKAVGVGSTTITCTAKDGSGAKATCAVTVYQPVTGVKLNTNKISWPVGKSGSFKATVTPTNAKNKALTWKSSNPKVATVDANGKLKAVGVGSTTITCTAKDGSGAKATCAVTVYQPVTGVKLNTNKISWPVGKSGSFKATVTPTNAKNKALTWKSSNPKVATVDANGKLKAVGVGSTTITCTAKDGNGAKATCAVTVYQPVTSVKLNTNKISWPVGKSGSFKATVTPTNAKNKALTWKSSNPKVATVDANGKLKAVGVGSTTITCTAKDGNGAKATCAVTVYQPVTSVKLNTNKISWPVGKSGSFKATVTPTNAKNKALTWKSSNPKVATVDANGKLKAVGVGSTTITCTAKDGSGAKATCEVTVYDPKVSVYKVGDKITYTAYLSGVNAPLCGLNASIRYDGGKVRFNDGSLSFPYIGKPIYNAYEKNEIMFNITNLDGFDFSKQEVLVQATFTVTNASFTSKDISLQIQEMLDFNAKDLKGTIKETVARG